MDLFARILLISLLALFVVWAIFLSVLGVIYLIKKFKEEVFYDG